MVVVIGCGKRPVAGTEAIVFCTTGTVVLPDRLGTDKSGRKV